MSLTNQLLAVLLLLMSQRCELKIHAPNCRSSARTRQNKMLVELLFGRVSLLFGHSALSLLVTEPRKKPKCAATSTTATKPIALPRQFSILELAAKTRTRRQSKSFDITTSRSYFKLVKPATMTSLATQVSIIDRMKKMGKTVVDAGAKTMLKVGHYFLCFTPGFSRRRTSNYS